MVGSPEQLSEIVVFRPGTVKAVIVNVADPPADTVALLAEDESENGAAFVPTICVIVFELAAKLASPL